MDLVTICSFIVCLYLDKCGSHICLYLDWRDSHIYRQIQCLMGTIGLENLLFLLYTSLPLCQVSHSEGSGLVS